MTQKVHPFLKRPEFANKLSLRDNRITVFSPFGAKFHLVIIFGCNGSFESLQGQISVAVAGLLGCHLQGRELPSDVSMENW